MNTIVENYPVLRYGKDEYHVFGTTGTFKKERSEVIRNLESAFMAILWSINNSSNEENLRCNIEAATKFFNRYFKFGFGGNHMWVKQICEKGRIFGDRIIFVEF